MAEEAFCLKSAPGERGVISVSACKPPTVVIHRFTSALLRDTFVDE